MSVAQTILSQIHPIVLAELGAREFLRDSGCLIFRVGPGSSRKARVTLDPSDTYTVECFRTFGSILAGTFRVEKVFCESDIYCDCLDDSLRRMAETWAVAEMSRNT